MKKLNRKGFTLIELLAVIVIMAIILIVTIPNIIQSINDARTNSIHNLAVSAANTYNTAIGQDLLATGTNKLLGNIPENISSNWKCIKSIDDESDKNLSEVLGLKNTDVNLGTTLNALTGTEIDASKITAETCSAIRLKNDTTVEVLLVAVNGGRFYVAQKVTYGLSTDTAGVSK